MAVVGSTVRMNGMEVYIRDIVTNADGAQTILATVTEPMDDDEHEGYDGYDEGRGGDEEGYDPRRTSSTTERRWLRRLRRGRGGDAEDYESEEMYIIDEEDYDFREESGGPESEPDWPDWQPSSAMELCDHCGDCNACNPPSPSVLRKSTEASQDCESDGESDGDSEWGTASDPGPERLRAWRAAELADERADAVGPQCDRGALAGEDVNSYPPDFQWLVPWMCPVCSWSTDDVIREDDFGGSRVTCLECAAECDIRHGEPFGDDDDEFWVSGTDPDDDDGMPFDDDFEEFDPDDDSDADGNGIHIGASHIRVAPVQPLRRVRGKRTVSALNEGGVVLPIFPPLKRLRTKVMPTFENGFEGVSGYYGMI